MVGRQIRGIAWVVTVLCAIVPTRVFAQTTYNEGDVATVLLQCEELTLDARAEIEARLVGELMVSEAPARLSLSCSRHEISGTIERADTRRSEERKRAASLSEELLALGMALIAYEPTDEADERHADLPQLSYKTDTLVNASNSDMNASGPRHTQTKPLAIAVALGGAVVYQHWGTQVAGALGPHLEGLLFLGKHAGVSVELEPMFALNTPQGYRMWELRGQMTGFVRILPWFSVGGGPLFSWMKAGGPSERTAAQTSSFRPGGMAYVEGILPGNLVEASAR